MINKDLSGIPSNSFDAGIVTMELEEELVNNFNAIPSQEEIDSFSTPEVTVEVEEMDKRSMRDFSVDITIPTE